MATKTAYPFRVEPQEVDFSLRITLVALGGNILNIAGIDAHTKGFGVDALNKDNFSWVLSRIAFEFDYRPEEYVKYEIATWISDYGRMLSTRNFELTDQTGVCFGRVVSQWCMLDLSKRTASTCGRWPRVITTRSWSARRRPKSRARCPHPMRNRC